MGEKQQREAEISAKSGRKKITKKTFRQTLLLKARENGFSSFFPESGVP